MAERPSSLVGDAPLYQSCSRREGQMFPLLLPSVRPMGNPLKAGSRPAAPCPLTTVIIPSIRAQEPNVQQTL